MYKERWGEYGGKAKLQRFTVNDKDDGEETEDEALPKAKCPKHESREPLILAICTPLMARALFPRQLKSCFVIVHPPWIALIHQCLFIQHATQQEESH